VIVVTLVALADSGWFAIFVLYAEQALNLTPSGFGALIAIGAGGGLTGALLADRAVASRGHVSVIGWSAAAATITPLSLLLLPSVWVAVVVVVGTSAAFGVLNVAAAGMRYRMVPHGLLGRVSAVWRTSAYGASAAGAIAGGAIASVAGLDAPFLLSLVVGAVAVTVWLATSRAVVSSA
jgi:MFS family permease